jgi:hypothetical protein
MRRQYLAGLSLLLLLFPCCRGQSRAPTPEPTDSAALTPQSAPKPGSNSNPTPERFTFEIPYTKDKLSYSGYQITIERKRVRVEEFTAENQVAVLKKNGRVIRTFNALRHPLGAFTRMALTPVLGGDDKQLIVEQTGPRDWAYWVVNLKPQFRVVFTNTVYPVGHELGLDDLDGDGIKELLMGKRTSAGLFSIDCITCLTERSENQESRGC